MLAKYANGYAPLKGFKATPAQIERRKQTRRQRAVGNVYKQRCGKQIYLMVMTAAGREYLHRVIMATKLGRPLLTAEVVHHKDGNTLNNNPDNLEIMTAGQHSRIHHAGVIPEAALAVVRLNGRWARQFECCQRCQGIERPHVAKGLCASCYQVQFRVTHRDRISRIRKARYAAAKQQN